MPTGAFSFSGASRDAGGHHGEVSAEVQHVLEAVRPWVDHYGYAAAFVGMLLENAGIPVPAETFLIALSFMASQGLLDIRIVIPMALAGDVLGDSLGFAIGRYGGRRLVERYGHFVRLDRHRMAALECLYAERGNVAVFTSQFFAVTRTVGALAAGLSDMRFRSFFIYDFAAACVYIPATAILVFAAGSNLDAVLRFFSIYRWVGPLILGVALVLFFWRRRARASPPSDD
jgi:membrane protein DedA with SNARE-associated domain